MRIIERFKEYTLTPESTLFGKFKNIMFGVGLYILWSSIVIWIYSNYIPDVFGAPDSFPEQHSLAFLFIGTCIFAPLFEEILYRLPLNFVRYIPVKGAITYFVIISSVLFGLHHWGGQWTVPIQGVLGFLFCWVYIKNGYSYVSTVLMHFLINLYMFIS